MGGARSTLTGPDLAQGVLAADVPNGGLLLGHARGEPVVVTRVGSEVFALGASCSHYGGPLAEGLVIDGTLRCPWHHAAFDLRTGSPVRPPALNAIACFDVVVDGDRVRVAEKRTTTKDARSIQSPASVLIIGAGAAGLVAAETLRAEGYSGKVTLVGAEATGPVDRPNLSKDYLAGTAPEDWIALRGPEFFASQDIELVTSVRAVSVAADKKIVRFSDGSERPYGALLLSTGAEPAQLSLPGDGASRTLTLRTLADSRRIIERAATAKTAVIIGSGFIGLEVAASLVARGLRVSVVSPDALPLQRVLGRELGTFVRQTHEAKGVIFHLESNVRAIHANDVELHSGARVPADLVVVGIGVRPTTGLASTAGLAVDGAILVDEFLRTSSQGIWAAGDVASWPDVRLGRRNRVEHWVVAQRQGRTAALNILGRSEPFRAVPFFWSQHYDVSIAYVGSGAGFDSEEVKGDPAKRDCLVAYRVGGILRAVATINRDRDNLLAENYLERGDATALERLVARS